MDPLEIALACAVGLIIMVILKLILTPSSPSKSPPTTLAEALLGASSFKSIPNFKKIVDSFKTIEEVQEALRKAGLESCNLIVGIDYTKSNEYTGKLSFRGQCLHHIDTDPKTLNPYQQVISILGNSLEVFDEDHKIPVFGFGIYGSMNLTVAGDVTTKAIKVFPFFPDRPCYGFGEVLTRYNEITPHVQLSGPTNFAPLIYEAINIVKTERDFHVLVIIADGQVTSERETMDAIVEASKYPLSIVMVGVGDGPWDQMKEFDDSLPQRNFDNFQFVNFRRATDSRNPEATFALHALMELPFQYKAIKKLQLL